MAISLDRFLELRPFLYHLTSSANAERVLRTRRIESAAALLRAANRVDLISVRRREHVQVRVGDETIAIRDQAPLHEGNLALERGWTLPHFVALLNSRVFFWPGTLAGPIAYGVRHYARYAGERPTILRVATGDLFAVNSAVPPEFCRYNSGSPRCSNGSKSPRNSKTFVRGMDADFRCAQVVEVTFSGGVHLPERVEGATAPTGPWRQRR